MGLLTARFSAICMVFLLGACSASGTHHLSGNDAEFQTISIHTPGTMAANCFVRVDGMSYPVATPGRVQVKPSRTPLDVTCFKGEHMVGNKLVPPSCPNCDYPSNVSIAMALDSGSMQRNVVMFAR